MIRKPTALSSDSVPMTDSVGGRKTRRHGNFDAADCDVCLFGVDNCVLERARLVPNFCIVVCIFRASFSV